MQKHASWVIALVLGIVIGVVGDRMAGGGGKAERPAPAPPPRPPQRMVEDPKAVYRVPVDDSPVRGPSDALVTIVESSDFECPFCKRVQPTLEQVEKAYPGKVRWVFKHNPLGFHPKALPAAEAAEEARAQGGDKKFWQMHDKLFELAPALDRPNLEKAAQELGLDLEAFRRALDTSRHETRIRRDQALVTGLGATGTPTFFVNGRKLPGAMPFESFQALVDEELRKAEEMVKAGTPPSEVYARIIEKGATSPVMVQGQAAAPQPPPPPRPAAAKVSLRPDDPARGPKAAKVTIAVFSDFQCPFCSRVEPTLQQLSDAYGKDVRIVWKHQPLAMHPQALPAAQAAEAARQQGRFWEMHDLMFRSQADLSPAKYQEWAKALRLVARKFQAASESPAVKARIEEDQRLAGAVGASATPTLYVNCRQIVGAQPYERFQALVDEQVRKADELLAKGAKLDATFYDRICDENVKAAGASAVAPAAAPPAAPAPPALAAEVALRPDDPVRGNPAAPVTIVLFSDFECPFCGRVEPTLKQVEQAYAGRVRIAWKHLPLPMHPNAVPAAEAAEAAREQGKFWEMHEKLFQNQRDLTPESFERFAKELKLDLGKFRQSMQSHRNRDRIEQDLALARRLGVNGTPAAFVNGELVSGAVPFEMFKAAVDRQLAKTAQR